VYLKKLPAVIFCIVDGRMVLLHAFMKKTQQIPQADLVLALRRNPR